MILTLSIPAFQYDGDTLVPEDTIRDALDRKIDQKILLNVADVSYEGKLLSYVLDYPNNVLVLAVEVPDEAMAFVKTPPISMN